MSERTKHPEKDGDAVEKDDVIRRLIYEVVVPQYTTELPESED